MSSAVPAGWNTVSLAEGIDILSGYPFDSSSFTNDSSKTGLIRIRDLVRQKVATYFDGAFDDNYLIRKGDVLIGMDGDFNIVKWNSAPSLLNQRICKVTVAGEIFDLAYLYQDLQKDLLEINNQTGSTTVKHLSVKDIRGIHKSYPPLPEQKKIASILTSVDEVIENTQKQIDKLQDLKKATMNELLTKGIGHTEFKDSELGRIPKSWEIKKVSQFTKEHKQGFYTKDGYQGNGVFLIRITDLQNPKIDYSEMPKLPVSEKDFISFKVDVGDFLFARSGAIGRYGIVSENYPAVFASYLIRFKFNDTVNTMFFGYIYESEYCQNQLSYITQGSSNININAENIKSLKVPYPPLVEQGKIASVLLSIDKNIEDKRHKLHQTQSLKKSLMQDLLTGKVRVTVN